MTTPRQIVEIAHEGSVAIVTLRKPETLNAFDEALARGLDAALRTVERDSAVQVVILTGEGRGFSAGQDIRELARETAERGPPAVGDQLRQRFNPIVLRIRMMEQPVIAAINGVTAGAGLGIALACDFRIAGEAASFVLSPIGIGLIPGGGSTALLPAIVGLARATELTLLGERIDASQALQLGLVTRVVPPDQLLPEALALAARLALLPTGAIGLTKRAFNHAALPGLREHLEYEAQLQEIAAGTADHREGLAALLQKRPATFDGR